MHKYAHSCLIFAPHSLVIKKKKKKNPLLCVTSTFMTTRNILICHDLRDVISSGVSVSVWKDAEKESGIMGWNEGAMEEEEGVKRGDEN